MGVDVLRAPYEADPQIALEVLQGRAYAALTDDNDVFWYALRPALSTDPLLHTPHSIFYREPPRPHHDSAADTQNNPVVICFVGTAARWSSE